MTLMPQPLQRSVTIAKGCRWRRLAAARVRLDGLSGLLNRLDSAGKLRALAVHHAAYDLPVRQRTLHMVIEGQATIY